MDSYIHFDNPTVIYSGGQIVSGRVEIKLHKAKSVRGIKIVLRGKASVWWRENRGKRKKPITYSAKENYFKEIIQIAQGFDGVTIELPAGQHIYPFKYLLPAHLPPSYENHYGNIRYSVKAVLDRPWKFNYKVKSPFVIEAPPDFIENRRIREPATLTMEKTFGFLMFKSHLPLTGILKVPQSGFICGESIPLTLEINNPSNVAVKGIKFEFNIIKRFEATSPHSKEKVSQETLWKSHVDCYIESDTSKTIKHEIDVPHFDIFHLTHCSIINIDYELKVEVQTVGLHLNMFGNLPIFPMNRILQSNLGTTNLFPVNNIPNIGTTNFYSTGNSVSIQEEKYTAVNIN